MSIDIVDVFQLAPPIAFSSGDDTPAPVPTDDFLTALRSFLLATPGLEDLTDAYWEESPPGVVYPFAVFSQLWEETTLILNHPSYSEWAYQISIFTKSAPQARAMGKAAHDRMLPTEGMEVMLFSEGVEMTRAPGRLTGPKIQPQGLIGGEKIYMVHFDCTWIVGQR